MQAPGSLLCRAIARGVRAATLPLAVAMLVGACASAAPPTPTPAPPGSDRDANGCNLSAGYQWCPRLGTCQRPVELANKIGFAQESFAGYCRIKRQ